MMSFCFCTRETPTGFCHTRLHVLRAVYWHTAATIHNLSWQQINVTKSVKLWQQSEQLHVLQAWEHLGGKNNLFSDTSLSYLKEEDLKNKNLHFFFLQLRARILQNL